MIMRNADIQEFVDCLPSYPDREDIVKALAATCYYWDTLNKSERENLIGSIECWVIDNLLTKKETIN